jgi:putative transposase
LSAYVGRVCALYGRHWHKSRNAGHGPLWQGRYKSIIVQKELYLNRLGRYIERNPITAGVEGIRRPWDYIWSSAAAYVSGKSDHLIEPCRHPYRTNWGGNENQQQANYAAYLVRNDDDDDRKIFSSGATFLGDDSFRCSLESLGGRISSRKKGRPLKQQ